MTNNNENTKDKWHLEDCVTGKIVVMKNENGREIGRIHVYPSMIAHRIVERVNMHDELIAALKYCKRFLNESADSNYIEDILKKEAK